MTETESQANQSADVQQTLDLLRVAAQRVCALASAEPCPDHARPIRKANLKAFEAAIDAAVAQAQGVVKGLPGPALIAIEKNLVAYHGGVNLQTAISMASDEEPLFSKENLLDAIEAVLKFLPIPGGWKTIIRIIIRLIRAVQAIL